MTQTPAADQFSSEAPGYPGPEPLPTLMSPREVSLLSPPMTRDQMMSSTMMPRDQMLASDVNPMPKILAVTDRKEQIMTSSRGSHIFLFTVLHHYIFRPTVVDHVITNGCNNLISFTNL